MMNHWSGRPIAGESAHVDHDLTPFIDIFNEFIHQHSDALTWPLTKDPTISRWTFTNDDHAHTFAEFHRVRATYKLMFGPANSAKGSRRS